MIKKGIKISEESARKIVVENTGKFKMVVCYNLGQWYDLRKLNNNQIEKFIYYLKSLKINKKNDQ